MIKPNRIEHEYTPAKARFVYLRRGSPGTPTELCISDTNAIRIEDNKLIVIELTREQHRSLARESVSLWFSGDDK